MAVGGLAQRGHDHRDDLAGQQRGQRRHAIGQGSTGDPPPAQGARAAGEVAGLVEAQHDPAHRLGGLGLAQLGQAGRDQLVEDQALLTAQVDRLHGHDLGASFGDVAGAQRGQGVGQVAGQRPCQAQVGPSPVRRLPARETDLGADATVGGPAPRRGRLVEADPVQRRRQVRLPRRRRTLEPLQAVQQVHQVPVARAVQPGQRLCNRAQHEHRRARRDAALVARPAGHLVMDHVFDTRTTRRQGCRRPTPPAPARRRASAPPAMSPSPHQDLEDQCGRSSSTAIGTISSIPGAVTKMTVRTGVSSQRQRMVAQAAATPMIDNAAIDRPSPSRALRW